MADVGILAFGAYVPYARLERKIIAGQLAWANPALKGMAKGEKAIASWDEDAITMAVAACRNIPASQLDGCGSLNLSSTTLPFEDRANSAVVAEALRLDESVRTNETTGSLRAATSSICGLADSRFSDGSAIVVASDKRPTKPGSVQEMQYGDAAAAIAVGEGNVIARIVATASNTTDLVDHYRTEESATDYALEDRWVRDEGLLQIIPDVTKRALDKASVAAENIDHVILPFAARTGAAIAKACGLNDDNLADDLSATVGHTGTAHALLMLASVLETAKAGETILLVGFGQGADAIVLEVTDAINAYKPNSNLTAQLASKRMEENYTRFLSFGGNLNLDWGMRAERDDRSALSTAFRKRRAVTGMIGGKCTKCGTPQFPKFRVCVECGGIDMLEDHCFADSNATVKTFTEDWQAYSPNPPLPYGNIAFAEGGNVFMEITDVEPGELAIGTPLRLVFRIKDFDHKRGFRRYFWKPTPIRAGDT